MANAPVDAPAEHIGVEYQFHYGPADAFSITVEESLGDTVETFGSTWRFTKVPQKSPFNDSMIPGETVEVFRTEDLRMLVKTERTIVPMTPESRQAILKQCGFVTPPPAPLISTIALPSDADEGVLA